MVFLKGNHEQIAISCLRDRGLFERWMRLGGLETLISYGITPGASSDDRADRPAAGGLSRRVAAESFSLLPGSAKLICLWRFLLRPCRGQDRTSSYRARRKAICSGSGRNFCRRRADFGKIIIHGHTPVQRHRGRAEPDQYRYRRVCDRPTDMPCDRRVFLVGDRYRRARRQPQSPRAVSGAQPRSAGAGSFGKQSIDMAAHLCERTAPGRIDRRGPRSSRSRPS